MGVQVWDYNGRPYLVMNENDFPDECTTIRPPEGIWEPFYFDEDKQKWIGSEPNPQNNDDDPTQPEEDIDKDNEVEASIANLMFENSMLKFSMEETQTEVANLTFLVSQLVPTESEES